MNELWARRTNLLHKKITLSRLDSQAEPSIIIRSNERKNLFIIKPDANSVSTFRFLSFLFNTRSNFFSCDFLHETPISLNLSENSHFFLFIHFIPSFAVLAWITTIHRNMYACVCHFDARPRLLLHVFTDREH